MIEEVIKVIKQELLIKDFNDNYKEKNNEDEINNQNINKLL